jgi:hypothetical protein
MRRLALAMLAAILLACGPMKADDNAAKIHGVWKVTSYRVQIVAESGPPRNIFGADPKGYVVFTPEARMMLFVTAANRKPATNDGETVALFKTMAAFSGRYVVDADKIVIMPDVSWNETYASDEQIYYYRIDGDNLSIRSNELKYADIPGKRVVATMDLVRERRAPVAAVNVRADAQAIDLADSIDRLKSEGDSVSAWTVPGADGKTRRIEVHASEANPSWMAFALANNSDEEIERLLVAPHYRLVGSGLLWPDLGGSTSPRAGVSGRSARTAAAPTFFASCSIPARSQLSSPSCVPIGCRSSSYGSPRPIRTRSTASRTTTESSSASSACSRCA